MARAEEERGNRRDGLDGAAVDWEELYRELGETVYRVIERITGDPSRAEDLTHDTFVKVHERRHQFRGRGSLHAWVLRIARNLALSTEDKRSNRLRLLRLEIVSQGQLVRVSVEGGPLLASHPTGAGSRRIVLESLDLAKLDGEWVIVRRGP